MANLATTYQALGDPQRARELNEQALAGRLQVFGHDHPDTLTIMANLATNLWAHGENPAGDDPFDDHPGTIRLKIDPAYPERGERWTILGSSERARDRGPVARGQGPQQGDRVTQGEGDITKSPRNP
jgi:hypothetical protein